MRIKLIALALLTLVNLSLVTFAEEIQSIGFDQVAVSLEPNSVSFLEIYDLPPKTSQVKVFMKNKKDSNLVLMKGRKAKKLLKKKVSGDSLMIPLKTGLQYSIHNLNIISYQKTKNGYKVIGADTIKAVVEGEIGCPNEQKLMCGIKYTDQSCPFEDQKICFFSGGTELVTYNNLCELERDGAEYLYEGICK